MTEHSPATHIKLIRFDPIIFPEHIVCCFRNAAVVTTNISGALVPNANNENPINVLETPNQSAILQHDVTTRCAPNANAAAEMMNNIVLFFIDHDWLYGQCAE